MLRRIAIALLCAASLLACSKSDGSGASPAASASSGASTVTPAAAAPSSGGACDVVTCANFSGSPGYVAGKADALPADVPAPPGGSSVCGATKSLRANYYTTSLTPDQVIAYYEKELPARGFTLKPRTNGPRACSIELSFHHGKGLQIGNIVAFVGGYGVTYFGS